MDNSNNKIRSECRSKILATFMVLIIVEAIIYGGYLIRYFDCDEFLQVALGTPVICLVMMPVVYFSSKRNGKGGLEYEKDSKRVTRGINDEGFPFVLIKGDIRNALSAWVFSFLLLALIVWRWEVDGNIVRKLLCAIFFGLLAIACFLIGWCVSHMKLIITFQSGKFIISRSMGPGVGKQMEFSYDKWNALRADPVQGNSNSALSIDGCNGEHVTINYKIPQRLADEICAYASKQIEQYHGKKRGGK